MRGNILKSGTIMSAESVLTAGPQTRSSAHVAVHSPTTSPPSFHSEAASSCPHCGHDPTRVTIATPSEPAPAPIDRDAIRQDILHELGHHFDDLLTALNNLGAARNELVDSMSHQVVPLALAMTEKIIQKAVEMDPAIIEGVISETFNKISGSDRIIFKINPDDAEAVTAFQPTIESRLVGVEKITFQHDSTIKRGGCIIETDLGFVDITIREKLAILADTLALLHRS
jgi:hypothetical protein